MQSKSMWRMLTAFTLMPLLFAACKKDMARNNGTTPGTGVVSSNDSIYDVFKDIYLWTDAVPDSATFKPDSYSTPFTMFDSLKGFKKNANGANLDKYSFLDNGTVAQVLSGHAGDLGFQVGFQTATELRVVYVYPGSPADLAGVKRGWKVTSINGTSSFQYGNQATYTLLDNAFGAASANFVFTKTDGTSQTSTITAAQYNLNPILYNNIFTLNGTKVGYIVFNSFVALNVVQSQFDNIFQSFAAAGVSNVIIDLRYNGGGEVATTEYLANKLAPASVTNKLMYSTLFNANVTAGKFGWLFSSMKALPDYPQYNWTDIFYSEATTYAKTNFGTTGSQNITKLSFIVTGNTASASELLYNVLLPSMTPRLVGRTTYGKPVGFIAVRIGVNDMYCINMQSLNSAGNGSYFNGLTPDVNVQDDYTNDWGSFSDPMLRAALTDQGIPASALGRIAYAESLRTAEIPTFFTKANQFKGMVTHYSKR
ncbi:MAG: hypothetical protein JO154_18730 [Chitinophaga sp.]|uniref:S41 family peptidase n=1 Tax=Chitinophaga sp. TaxID=1869181 RepID=UPI0025C5C75C|nr:S41 family peptidase [Chitinophaga sp.]MBV8254644.1 hypothetical protein [Chitinophaga sp.]